MANSGAVDYITFDGWKMIGWENVFDIGRAVCDYGKENGCVINWVSIISITRISVIFREYINVTFIRFHVRVLKMIKLVFQVYDVSNNRNGITFDQILDTSENYLTQIK